MAMSHVRPPNVSRIRSCVSGGIPLDTTPPPGVV
eukprot:CAMPEP_0169307192 /NCGR_PEP_ID=MMETSP1017-20121227/1164_1 /TAXON_ID=342587 /ORGANISM="Karlodinium micrum, Strain CCMP2283" /LENGTH=33 /DNA_ID= /DNA_START= /DNA_END= /DNA_ORIENTATION=